MGHWIRRRRSVRRDGDQHGVAIDWHSAHWLGAGILVLLLSVADAFLTLTLLRHGAHEANPLMAHALGAGRAFAYWKLALTSVGVVVLVSLARIRLFGLIPAGALLYLVLACYIGLIAYEWQLLVRLGTDVISY
jgi:hypothetical protein